MILKPVDGTQIRGGKYHLNLRIPADAATAFPGKTHIRRSLKTSGEKQATDAVTLAKAEIIQASARARQGETLAQAVAALPPEQRAVYAEAGGLTGLLTLYNRTDKARAFLIAGGAITDAELRDDIPTDTERRLAQAHLKTDLDFLAASAVTEAKALKGLGVDVKAPATFGLREIVEGYVEAKNIRGQTADTVRSIVERFIELHGDLELADLRIAHLREYITLIKDLPKIQSTTELRTLKLPELVRVAKLKKLTPIGDGTRIRHVNMLKALTGWAPSQGFLTADPWSAYKLTVPKRKHSAPKTRVSFSGAQIAAVLLEASTHPIDTIDHWAPLLAAYQGARQEEIGQLRAGDVRQDNGVWVMRITDEGDGQKVKNAASFRTIPLHQKVLDAGFAAFAAQRPVDGFLFMEQPR